MTDPLEALVQNGGVLAVIANTEGPAYRSAGTMMAVLSSGETVGSVSSGCIDADVACHAKTAMDGCQAKSLRYGIGSPFLDIELPCGGGLEILLVSQPDKAVLTDILKRRHARDTFTVCIDRKRGTLTIFEDQPSEKSDDTLMLRDEPPVKVLAIGQGDEVKTFARLCRQVPFSTTVLSPDKKVCDAALAADCTARELTTPSLPADLSIDAATAVVLFFHDHEWEPPLLHALLQTDAFYLGAQGSQQARSARNQALHSMGVTAAEVARIKAPVGLIKSAREPETLAISVLAEIVSIHKSL